MASWWSPPWSSCTSPKRPVAHAIPICFPLPGLSPLGSTETTFAVWELGTGAGNSLGNWVTGARYGSAQSNWFAALAVPPARGGDAVLAGVMRGNAAATVHAGSDDACYARVRRDWSVVWAAQ